MKTPPFLLGVALLFWGWQTDMLATGLAVGVALESSRWIKFRFDLEQDHFNRLWNLSWILFIGTAMYIFFAKGGFSAVNDFVQTESLGVRSDSLKQVSSSAMVFVQWLPLVYVPFMAAFVFSHTEELPWTTFTFLYQKQHEEKRRQRHRYLENIKFNPTYPYLVMVLMAATATITHREWFFACAAGLVLWGILPFRNQRFSMLTWASAFGVAIVIAFGGQLSLVVLQKQLQRLQNQIMNSFGQPQFDTFRTRTAIGSVGRLHQSNKIILRVSTPDGQNPPGLLQEGAYNLNDMVSGTSFWTAKDRNLQQVYRSSRKDGWILNEQAIPKKTVSAVRYSVNNELNLALPSEPIIIDNLDALSIHTNRFGAVRADQTPRVASYRVGYGESGGFAQDPEPADYDVNQLDLKEQEAVDQIAQQLRFSELNERDSISAIRAFFLSEFTYSTFLNSHPAITNSDPKSPLAAFLLDHKSGHCEYFAASTVHLLRAAGIPARYAVGYAVQEKRGDNEWIVRSRHAHAWALAWIDDRWQEIDNTPANWNSIEESKSAIWQPVSDWLSDILLEFNRWRQGDSQMRMYVFAAGVLVLGFMAWRQVSGKRWSRSKRNAGVALNRDLPGLDSAFYRIEVELGKRVAPRKNSEPMQTWIARLGKAEPGMIRELPQLIELHYRLRFDPSGLSRQETQALSEGVQAWLTRYFSLTKSSPYKS